MKTLRTIHNSGDVEAVDFTEATVTMPAVGKWLTLNLELRDGQAQIEMHRDEWAALQITEAATMLNETQYTAYCVEVQYKEGDHWTRIMETASERLARKEYDKRREPAKRIFRLEHTAIQEKLA